MIVLVEVHILQNHAPSNLNRDDTGSPKEAIFGGYKRARISSQCLKRSIRKSDLFQGLFSQGMSSVRTRSLPAIIKTRLIDELDEILNKKEKERINGLIEIAAHKLKGIAKSEKKEKNSNSDETKKPKTAQTIFFRQEEIELIYDAVKQCIYWDDSLNVLLDNIKGKKDNEAKRTLAASDIPQNLKNAINRFIEASEVDFDEDVEVEEQEEVEVEKKKKKTLFDKLKNFSLRHISPVTLAKIAGVEINTQFPVDICLFGRMVTNPVFLDVEASCQFAHAISTHKVDHEFDYYTAMDDLERSTDDEAGAGADMIGDIEFNSACYYKYFNVHVEGLVDNLTGKAFRREVSAQDEKEARETATKAIRALIEAACSVSPSGKQNSFAAHQLPSLVWVELRDNNLPVSYANAFSFPVNPKVKDGLETESAKKLKEECESLTEMYTLKANKRLLLSKNKDIEILGVSSEKSLESLLKQLEAAVMQGD